MKLQIKAFNNSKVKNMNGNNINKLNLKIYK